MSDDSDRLFFGAVRVTGFTVSTSAGSSKKPLRKLALTRLDIDGLEGELGELHYRADEVSLDGLHGLLGRGQITAEAADAAGLHLRGQGFAAHIRSISCASGLLSAGVHELVAPHVSFEDVKVVIDDVGAVLSGRSPTSTGAPLDLRCLDALQGQLDIDLAVDMTLPWLKKRRSVTHYFRIPIVDGTVDYERLEDDVHWLEAAFLTIDQVDDQLILARDLPLVPYAGKALLTWRLEPEDIPVADMRRVHLRNLMRPRVPSKRREKGKSRLVLHALAMQNIKLALHVDRPVQLSLPGGAMLQFGDDESAGMAGLTLAGELRHIGEPPADKAGAESRDQKAGNAPSLPDTRGPTSLRGSVDLLDVTLQDLRLGGATVSVDRLHIGSIERIELAFDGFRPQRLEISIGRMAATNLRIHAHT